ncbi:MAG TPA: SDR family oxidoreductase [Xanthomonadales bacterium]|nr:SDR family oxidoreductase [Xanthomonadales bacterium]
MAKVLVTGANRGIGLEFCRQLAERGDDVIAVCREASPELLELAVQVLDKIDVSDDGNIDRLRRHLHHTRLDLLINNAGILVRDSLEHYHHYGLLRQFEVNAVAPLRVATELLGSLGRGSKIVTITSSMSSIEENTSGGYYGYRMSKVAVNMAMKSLSVDLKDRGIGVFLLHPGYVATDMTEYSGPVSPAVSVRDMLERINELQLSDTGSFHHAQGREIPW